MPSHSTPPTRRMINSFRGLAIVALMAALATPLTAAPSGPEYRLGPLDKLRIRVHEWRPSKDEVFEWTAIKEDYSVGAAGTLNLPLAGEVQANGLTAAELSRLIGDKLMERMGLVQPPDISVEVVQYRPFYIVGQVDKPGEYPFRPGMTVLQAISVAGGMQRVSDMGLFRLERDAISAKGELSQISTETNSLRARKSRLEAELKNANQIDFAKELQDQKMSAAVNVLLEQETRIFDARRKGLSTQLQALEQLKGYLSSEIESLHSQVEKEDVQIKLVQKELDSVASLVDKGLSSAPRQLLLQRTIAQIEGERLRLNTSVVKAKQELSKTDISILDLKNKWTNDINTELRQTQAALEQQANRSVTTNSLLYEATVTAPHFIAERARSHRNEPVLKIVRDVEGFPVETTVPDTASVAPGDTIKVEIPLADPPEVSSVGGPAPSIATAPAALPAQPAPDVATDTSSSAARSRVAADRTSVNQGPGGEPAAGHRSSPQHDAAGEARTVKQ